MKHCGWLAAFLAHFLITASIADESPHVCVSGQSGDNDIVGERLIYNIKELVRKSRAMKLMPSEGETDCLRLIVITMNSGGPARNNATIYSVTWVVSFSGYPGNQYVTSEVGTCGSSRVLESAEAMVAHTEKLLSSMTPPSGETLSPSPAGGR
jgi:hypothetical protein